MSIDQESVRLADELPQGWKLARLGDVCEIIMGRTPRRDTPDYWGGSLPWVSIADLNNGIVSQTNERITRLGAEASNSRLISTGTLLYSFKLTIGKMAVAGTDLYTNEAIAGLVPRDSRYVDVDFLKYAMKSADHGSEPSFAVKGRTLNLQSLSATRIVLPPLPEQKRISAILNEQMTAVENAKAACEAQLEAAKQLPAAYLRSVFDSPEAKTWESKRLAELLAAPLKTGISKPNSPTADKRCLTLSSVHSGVIDISASKEVDVSDHEAKNSWVQPNAFYVVRGNGNLSLVGRGALAPPSLPDRILYPDLLIQVVPDRSRLLPEFLRFAWNCREVRTDIEDRARTSNGIFKINLGNLAEVKLPVPPLAAQARLASEFHNRRAVLERLASELAMQQKAINNLPAAILRKAFQGEL